MIDVTEMTDYGRFQTRCDLMKEVLRGAEKAAWMQASVYIYGEQGTGRRSLGRWIHDRSPQRGERFIQWSPIEDTRIQAGDTVLIENIHELDASQLLKTRKLIEEFSAAGGSRVRFIVTSETDAQEWMESSTLARDLAYRLCKVTLRMPSLQERAEDIESLASLFLNVVCLVNGIPAKTLSHEATQALCKHSWVGHVSELNNAIERAALRTEGSEIKSADLMFLSQTSSTSETLALAQAGISLFEMERKLIFQTLEMTRQNKTRAAQILGISIRTLRNKLNAYRERGVHEQRLV